MVTSIVTAGAAQCVSRWDAPKVAVYGSVLLRRGLQGLQLLSGFNCVYLFFCFSLECSSYVSYWVCVLAVVSWIGVIMRYAGFSFEWNFWYLYDVSWAQLPRVMLFFIMWSALLIWEFCCYPGNSKVQIVLLTQEMRQYSKSVDQPNRRMSGNMTVPSMYYDGTIYEDEHDPRSRLNSGQSTSSFRGSQQSMACEKVWSNCVIKYR